MQIEDFFFSPPLTELNAVIHNWQKFSILFSFILEKVQ